MTQKRGILRKIDMFDKFDSAIYYVDFGDNKDVSRLTDKLIDTLGFDRLESLIGKEHTWEIIEWNHLSTIPSDKHRVNKFIK